MHQDDRRLLDRLEALLGEAIPPFPDENRWHHRLGYALDHEDRINHLNLRKSKLQKPGVLVGHLEMLPHLTFLALEGNQIQDIRPLQALTALTDAQWAEAARELRATRNLVSDITAFAKDPGSLEQKKGLKSSSSRSDFRAPDGEDPYRSARFEIAQIMEQQFPKEYKGLEWGPLRRYLMPDHSYRW